MLQQAKCTCNHHSPNINIYRGQQQFDPTRTLSLRNAFASQMGRRFAAIRRAINVAIIDEDVFALRPDSGGFATLAAIQTPGAQAFDFPRSGDKVAAFMDWLRKQEQAGILEVTRGVQLGTAIEQAWTNQFIEAGYRQGVTRARSEMRKAGHNVPTMAETGGIDVVMRSPIHADRVGLLFTRTFNDLRGITDAMDSQISRVLSQAMADGKGPREIARLLTSTIKGPVAELGITDTLGRFIPAERRAKMLARTEIIRAHAEGQLKEFENWQIEGLRIKSEFVTAGDDRVCQECLALEGQIFTLKEAQGIIPVHPGCRCVWLPVDVR